MSVTLTGITANPTTVAPGGTSVITPVFSDPTQTITINGVDSSSTGDKQTVQLTISADPVTVVVDATLPTTAPTNTIALALTGAGTLVVNSDGKTLTYTAPAS